MNYCVYILYSHKLDKFYTGTTNDFSKRLAEHNSGIHLTSFSRKGMPWEFYLIIEDLESSQALKIEAHIKKMKSKKYIKNLAKYPKMVAKLKILYR